MNNTAYLKMDY